MKKWLRLILLLTFVLAFFGCGKAAGNVPLDTPDALVPAVMYNGEVYCTTGKQIPAEVDKTAVVGAVTSVVPLSQWPAEEWQANFGEAGTPLAWTSDGLLALVDNEWTVFALQSSGELPASQTNAQTWSEQDLAAMFRQAAKPEWGCVKCVVFPDRASARVGAALFQDRSTGTVNVAFFDEDGYFQQVGTEAELAEEPGFTYLGNGAVTFQLKGPDGKPYHHTFTITADEDGVNFTSENDLTQ